MEYVVGRTLKEVITDSGALDYQTAVKYAIGIASALKQAHDHAIVHCDVKSQNILIDTKGVAKITDFGIARAFGQPSESGRTGRHWFRLLSIAGTGRRKTGNGSVRSLFPWRRPFLRCLPGSFPMTGIRRLKWRGST